MSSVCGLRERHDVLCGYTNARSPAFITLDQPSSVTGRLLGPKAIYTAQVGRIHQVLHLGINTRAQPAVWLQHLEMRI